MAYKKISAEAVNSDRGKWHITWSEKNAHDFAKDASTSSKPKRIYRLPNGAFAIRKGKKGSKLLARFGLR